ncbi:hypothetical protein Goklo_000094 [Gossypium klotzschianum]|uniref:Uncharacterized protein n=1 Tax=Gossypium klotzschianum TaxID=34286 RepID=A0A7J8W9C0_9ROSI|nr:hypothetical protein [Gossypium klotzschianum]
MFPDLHNALSNACEAAGLRKKPEVIIIPTTTKVISCFQEMVGQPPMDVVVGEKN